MKIEARDLFRRPLVPPELEDVDAVVFDPPRQGAQAQCQQLAKSKVPHDRRGVVQRRHLRARRRAADRRRLHDRSASRLSTSSATRRMSNWSARSRAE